MLKRLFLWFKIRSLEATIYGREELYQLIEDRMLLANMQTSNELARSELRRLKREYRDTS